MYDIVIVGAGVAGLRVGIELLRAHPTRSCCLVEKYGSIGGRVQTFHHKIPKVGPVQWENGAGRISTQHHKVLALLKKYHLTTIPISNDLDYLDCQQRPNPFSSLCSIFLKPLASLPTFVLQTQTLGQLLEEIHGAKAKEFYQMFPYYSEIHVLRADLALRAFSQEMGTHSFVICKEGLGAMIGGMKEEFLKKGGTIMRNAEVTAVARIHGTDRVRLDLMKDGKREILAPLCCVFAVESEAAKKIHGLSLAPVLRHLKMMPLLRIYAVFPSAWFSDLPKIVTPSPIRYILPMGGNTIMISYTDGADADYWMRQPPSLVPRRIMKEIRRLFPERDIPDPIFMKLHPWKNGCTYWTRGNYSVEEESRKSLQPLEDMPSVFLCGESYAVTQCWVESALNQADRLLAMPAFIKSIEPK